MSKPTCNVCGREESGERTDLPNPGFCWTRLLREGGSSFIDDRCVSPTRDEITSLVAQLAESRAAQAKAEQEGDATRRERDERDRLALACDARADAAEAERDAARANGYALGWNDRDEQASEKESPEMQAMLKRHRERWWTATHSQRLADMAEYAEAKIAQKHRYAHQGVADTLLWASSLCAQISMLVSTLGGEVEGQPTGTHNYLQRVRALLAAEADLAAARAEAEGIREALREIAAACEAQDALDACDVPCHQIARAALAAGAATEPGAQPRPADVASPSPSHDPHRKCASIIRRLSAHLERLLDEVPLQDDRRAAIGLTLEHSKAIRVGLAAQPRPVLEYFVSGACADPLPCAEHPTSKEGK